MSDMAFVDYQLLFEKAAEWQRDSGSSSGGSGGLRWLKYDIDLIRVQHDRSSSPEPAVHGMLQAMAASQKEARTIRVPKGRFPLQVTGAIARMQSPFIVELPCVGRYSDDGFSLHASAILQQQQHELGGSDDSSGELTLVELSIEAVRESKVESGSRASKWRGQYTIKEYQTGISREKGPLKLEHAFKVWVNATLAEGAR